jgi:solute carrier family 50 protein (sugar transporter)
MVDHTTVVGGMLAPWWVQWCGNLAPVASILGCCSPYPTVRRIQREGRVGNLPLLPYTIMIINSLLYLAYGLLLREIRIWSGNAVGLLLGMYYFRSYRPFVPTERVLGVGKSSPLPGTLQQHVQAIGVAVGFISMSILLASRESAAQFIGTVAMVVCVSLYASPLSVIRVVLETKNSRCIPLPFTVAMTINCFLWTVFGLWQANDANIYIPSGLGLIFSLAQVGLKLYFEGSIFHDFLKKGTVSGKELERDEDIASTNISPSSQPSLLSGAAKRTATSSKVAQQV